MSYRPERLAHELKDLISSIIARELHDPRIGFATVTEVKVSRDLRHVRVFVSVFEEAARQKETIAALNHAAGFVRHEVFSRLRLRHSPEIVFALDESVARGDKMTRLIDEISRDLPRDTTAEATPDADSVNTEFSRHHSELNDQPPHPADRQQPGADSG